MQYADETEVIAACKSNSRLAQKIVYDRYAPLFFTVCKRYSRDMQDAELMLQDTFLKIFQNIYQYENKGSFEGWMKKILLNTCLDFVKSKQYKKEQSTIYPEVFPDMDVRVSWNDAVRKMNQEHLLGFIQQLPPTTQLVFNLYALDGFSHKEIAALTGMSEGTSQWHVSCARTNLKQKIKDILNIEIHNHEASRIG